MFVNIQEDIQLEFEVLFLMVNYEDLSKLLDQHYDMNHSHESVKIKNHLNDRIINKSRLLLNKVDVGRQFYLQIGFL
jgi:hypothetical protein